MSDRLRESLSEVALRKSVQLARLRELVIGTVGHDLRSPLTAIRMAASLMDGTSSEADLFQAFTTSRAGMAGGPVSVTLDGSDPGKVTILGLGLYIVSRRAHGEHRRLGPAHAASPPRPQLRAGDSAGRPGER